MLSAPPVGSLLLPSTPEDGPASAGNRDQQGPSSQAEWLSCGSLLHTAGTKPACETATRQTPRHGSRPRADPGPQEGR